MYEKPIIKTVKKDPLQKELFGIELDLFLPFDKKILGNTELEDKELIQIMDKMISGLANIKKRSFLSKDEYYICSKPGGSIFAIAIDKQNIEYNSFPFILDSPLNVDSIIFSIFENLSFLARRFISANVDPWTILLPINPAHIDKDKSFIKRLGGIQLNFSGITQYEKIILTRLVPLFSVCSARNTIAGVRSARVSLLSAALSIDLGQEEAAVPVKIKERFRGNGVSLSLPSLEWMSDIKQLKKLLCLFIDIHKYVSSAEFKQDCWLIKIDSDAYLSLLQKVNKADAPSEDIEQFINHIKESLPERFIKKLGLINLRKKLKPIPERKYLAERTLGHFIVKNSGYIKKIAPGVKPLEAITTPSPVTDYFFSDRLNEINFVDMDWSLSTVNVEGTNIIIPNEMLMEKKFSLSTVTDVNNYALKRIDQSMETVTRNYSDSEIQTLNFDKTTSILRRIILEGKELRYNLNSGNISGINENIILLLGAWMDCNKNIITSSSRPWTFNTSLFSPFDGSADLKELSRRVLNKLPHLMMAVYKKYSRNMILQMIKIEGSSIMLDQIQKRNRDHIREIQFIEVNNNDQLLIFEKLHIANLSGILGLYRAYLRFCNVEETDSMVINRNFLIYLINRIMPYFTSERLKNEEPPAPRKGQRKELK